MLHTLISYDFKVRSHGTAEDIASDVDRVFLCRNRSHQFYKEPSLPYEYKKLALRFIKDGKVIEKIGRQFKELINLGKKVSVNITIHKSSDLTFSSEVKDKYLEEYIEEAIMKFSAKNNYRISGITDYKMQFSEVRIPLLLEDGTNYSSNSFARDIKRYLKEKAGVYTGINIIGSSIHFKIK